MNIGVKPDEQTKLYDEIGKLTGWEREQTNKEWIQSATTEQLAEFLACVEARQNADYNEETKAWVEWLKQPHNAKE